MEATAKTSMVFETIARVNTSTIIRRAGSQTRHIERRGTLHQRTVDERHLLLLRIVKAYADLGDIQMMASVALVDSKVFILFIQSRDIPSINGEEPLIITAMAMKCHGEEQKIATLHTINESAPTSN